MLTELQKLLTNAVNEKVIMGQLKINESMASHTTWRIGGNAEVYYQPGDAADLQNLLKLVPEETPVCWIGLGSNVLIRDGGLNGLVINTNGVLNTMTINCNDKDECIITAQAGLPCAIFSRKAANENIDGAEFLSGIPGTIGGALAMNAGAFGGETWRQVVNVEMIDRNGVIHRRLPQEFKIAYRYVEQLHADKQEWFLSGTFRFEKNVDGLAKSKQAIKKLLNRRAETQPTKQANAGSVFKNPQGDHAARLIESCGLKGLTVNDAQVSEKHANFIINLGNARASDVEALIKKIQNTVAEKYQVNLIPEVRIIGKAANEQSSMAGK
jgi:UDP-N-acetylmuramate dehydrogenase